MNQLSGSRQLCAKLICCSMNSSLIKTKFARILIHRSKGRSNQCIHLTYPLSPTHAWAIIAGLITVQTTPSRQTYLIPTINTCATPRECYPLTCRSKTTITPPASSSPASILELARGAIPQICAAVPTPVLCPCFGTIPLVAACCVARRSPHRPGAHSLLSLRQLHEHRVTNNALHRHPHGSFHPIGQPPTSTAKSARGTRDDAPPNMRIYSIPLGFQTVPKEH